MKVIDLLNKVANGEEVPKYIKYRNWNNNSFDKMLVCKENIFYKLDQLEIYLNDEVEIIEEDKEIEELREYVNCGFCGTCEDFERKDLSDSLIKIGNKVNEIIRELNELKKGK